MKTLLTTSEAAEAAGVSPATIRRWCDRCGLHHYRASPRGRRKIAPLVLASFTPPRLVKEKPDAADRESQR